MNVIGPVAVSDRVSLIAAGTAVVLVVGTVVYVRWKAGKVLDAVNPMNNQNAISTGVNSALKPALGTNPLTNKPNTIGSWLYGVVH